LPGGKTIQFLLQTGFLFTIAADHIHMAVQSLLVPAQGHMYGGHLTPEPVEFRLELFVMEVLVIAIGPAVTAGFCIRAWMDFTGKPLEKSHF